MSSLAAAPAPAAATSAAKKRDKEKESAQQAAKNRGKSATRTGVTFEGPVYRLRVFVVLRDNNGVFFIK